MPFTSTFTGGGRGWPRKDTTAVKLLTSTHRGRGGSDTCTYLLRPGGETKFKHTCTPRNCMGGLSVRFVHQFRATTKVPQRFPGTEV